MPRDEIDEQDATLLERLGALARVVDPVPDHVVELGRAAFAFRDADLELMRMVPSPVDLAAERDTSGASHLHFFEHGDVSIDVEVTVRGGFATVVGVVTVTAGAAGAAGAASAEGAQAGGAGLGVLVETVDSSTTVDVVDGRFSVPRLPLGLARLVLERGGRRTMTTGWFEVG